LIDDAGVTAGEFLIPKILNSPRFVAIAEIRLGPAGQKGWAVRRPHVINIQEYSIEPIGGSDSSAMIDNWRRLGLVRVSYSRKLIGDNAYDWVLGRPEYETLKKHVPPEIAVTIGKGPIERTSFGSHFSIAVGMMTASRSLHPQIESRP
jgi:hypothetical protein